jgi:hypothetical protein
MAVGGIAAAAPAAHAQSFGCPQLLDRYPMEGWPLSGDVENRPYCPYIGYPVSYGEAEQITAAETESSFATRAVNAGYTEDERAYTDWIGTKWDTYANGASVVSVIYYIPPWADDNGSGYYCVYDASVSGNTGYGNWTYHAQQNSCSTYTLPES